MGRVCVAQMVFVCVARNATIIGHQGKDTHSSAACYMCRRRKMTVIWACNSEANFRNVAVLNDSVGQDTSEMRRLLHLCPPPFLRTMVAQNCSTRADSKRHPIATCNTVHLRVSHPHNFHARPALHTRLASCLYLPNKKSPEWRTVLGVLDSGAGA